MNNEKIESSEENNPKTDLPITALADSILQIEPDSNRPNHIVIKIKEKGNTQKAYYASPLDFDRYIDDKSLLKEINNQAIENLREFKRSWVKLGVSILLVKATYSYKIKYDTFEKFCEEALHLHRASVYEIMRSTLFLMQEKRELFDAVIADKDTFLPSYHSIYLLAQKKNRLVEGEYKEFLESLFKGEISTSEVQDKIKELTIKESPNPKKKTSKVPSFETFIRDFEKIYKRAGSFPAIDKQIKSEMQTLLDKLRKVEA